MSAEIGGNNPTARRPAGEAANPQLLYPAENPKPRAKQAAKRQAASAKPADRS